MKYFKNRSHHLFATATLLTILALAPSAFAQSGDVNLDQGTPAAAPANNSPANAPAMSELKGVKIGMDADEVIEKLGKPETSDAAGMYFELSKGEAMQLALDNKKVITMSMFYNGKGSNAPKFADVFGSTVQPEKQENGSVFKRIRYPELGIWVAYSRIGEDDDSMTTVTIQKIR